MNQAHEHAQDPRGRFMSFMTTTMSDRLKKARVSAGFYKASDAINKFGWKASTYRAHESRQNQFDATTALSYARAYGVNAGWSPCRDYTMLGDPTFVSNPPYRYREWYEN